MAKFNSVVVFAELWREPFYVELHRIKDSIKPFADGLNAEESAERLARFDDVCFRINGYEKGVGVK